jgi:DNA polymerase III, alpha subunit
MEKYLKDTYGITVYQEQVMLLARQLANFTRGQSDTLRKAMGKKMIDKMNELEALFYEGGKQNGHDPKVLNKIWEDWKKFASYAFNKSHATCYSWVSFQTAYLKAHYPAEYMAAVLSRNLNNIVEITKFIDECRAIDIKVLGPNVNESRQKFSPNHKGEIRFGLSAIKGIGEAATLSIVEEREKNGDYKDIYDFVQRVNLSSVNKKCLELLALSGALDCFTNIKREQYLTKNAKGEVFIDNLIRYGQRYQAEQNEAQNSLFGGEDAANIAVPTPPELDKWSQIELLNRERECVGIYLSAHPLDEFNIVLKGLCNTKCTELEDLSTLSTKENIVLGGIITSVESRLTKTGKPCGFVVIEDFNGSGRIALFGEEWAKWQGMLREGYTVFIRAKCSQRFKDSKFFDFRISDIKLLQTVKEESIDKITLHVNVNDLNEELVDDLMSIVSANKGSTQLFLQVNDHINNTNFLMRAREREIELTHDFLSYIEQHENISYTVN